MCSTLDSMLWLGGRAVMKQRIVPSSFSLEVTQQQRPEVANCKVCPGRRIRVLEY